MNNPFFLAIFGLGVIVNLATIVGVLFWLSKRQQKLTATFGEFAEAHSGTLEPGGLLKYPKVHFQHNNRSLTLEVYSSGGKHPTFYMQLLTDWPDSQLRCTIAPENCLTRLGKKIGLGDLEIGHPSFDDAFFVRGNDEQQIHRLLDGKVSAAFLQLWGIFQQSDLWLSINTGKLTLRKQNLLRDLESIQQLTDTALPLIDELFHQSEAKPGAQQQQAPKQQSAAAPATPAPDSRSSSEVCQFCGMMIEKDLVFCKSCQTAHHRGCWKSTGCCSSFGCKQRKYIEAAKV